MVEQSRHGLHVVLITFLVAMILSVIPLPEWAQYYRPDWLGLVLIYWCMAIPNRIGVGVGWTLGLVMDVLHGAILGQYALAMTITAFLTLGTYRRVRVFPLWQQSIVVLLILWLQHAVILWIRGIIGEAPDTWYYWATPVVSMLLWPWVFVALRDLRRRHKVR